MPAQSFHEGWNFHEQRHADGGKQHQQIRCERQPDQLLMHHLDRRHIRHYRNATVQRYEYLIKDLLAQALAAKDAQDVEGVMIELRKALNEHGGRFRRFHRTSKTPYTYRRTSPVDRKPATIS